MNYLQPGLSSLLSRRVYTVEQVRSEALRRADPESYAQLVREKYIKGDSTERPAVNAVNMTFAGLAGLELLMRIHPCRLDGNAGHARRSISATGGFWIKFPEGPVDEALARHVGHGDTVPLLDMPALDLKARAA